MPITREELKVGETYLSEISKVKKKVLFIGSNKVFYNYSTYKEFESSTTIKGFIEDVSVIVKTKKRFYLWDAADPFDGIFKCIVYLDDEGFTSSGKKWSIKGNLIKKHESEFIEIEVENE